MDLVVDPTSVPSLDEDECAHVRRLGIITVEERFGPFANAGAWASWRWDPVWSVPRLPKA
ncbi:hypothetical protein [Streptomyces sp. NBC_00576]|uniref:hypothetical protein n=1 Tax=Streptomyces sp. NBC_00576 TaxID=2903665 RepID=UPI002E816DF6|nr:hypothetical protein [Streptomyces sp. NBC_00576]WUB68772.1 hypothetical protein OG734_00920 [Streptomyces sp. NBC_00576]